MPIGLVAHLGPMVAAHPLLQGKGPAEHPRAAVELVDGQLAEIEPFHVVGKDVHRQPAQAQALQVSTIGLGKGDAQSAIVEDLDIGDAGHLAPVHRVQLAAHQRRIAKVEIVRRDRPAVGPCQPLAQVKGVRPAVVADCPPLGKIACQLACKGIDAQQPLKHPFREGARGRVGSQDRVRRSGIGIGDARNRSPLRDGGRGQRDHHLHGLQVGDDHRPFHGGGGYHRGRRGVFRRPGGDASDRHLDDDLLSAARPGQGAQHNGQHSQDEPGGDRSANLVCHPIAAPSRRPMFLGKLQKCLLVSCGEPYSSPSRGRLAPRL